MEAPSKKAESSHASGRLDRKTAEKNRRILMKSLFAELDAILPYSKQGVVGVLDRLDEAASYIKGLQERVEKLKEMAGGLTLPHIEVQDLGSALGVVLISRPVDRLVFYEIVRVLEEEGAEVVNANFSVVDDKAFHTVHSLVTESRIGCEGVRISERLKKAVHEFIGAV